MTIDEDLAAEIGRCDARFEAHQADLVAAFRREGVPDAEMREALAYAHGEYWRESRALLDRLRVTLTRIAALES